MAGVVWQVECVPKKIMLKSLVNVTSFGSKFFVHVIKTSSYWIRVSTNSYTKRKRGPQTHTHRGKAQTEDGHVVTKAGGGCHEPRDAGNRQEREQRGRVLPGAFGGGVALPTLDSDFRPPEP